MHDLLRWIEWNTFTHTLESWELHTYTILWGSSYLIHVLWVMLLGLHFGEVGSHLIWLLENSWCFICYFVPKLSTFDGSLKNKLFQFRSWVQFCCFLGLISFVRVLHEAMQGLCVGELMNWIFIHFLSCIFGSLILFCI